MIKSSVRSFPLVPLLGASLFWFLFALAAPTTVGWRDSGEYILSAFYLDIPHSAGFPLYTHLAHLFTLIPIGPIAWRVHLFSAATAAGCGLLASLIVFEVTRTRLLLSHKMSSLMALIPFGVLLGTIEFHRQALSAEVYLLNAFFILFVAFVLLKGINEQRSAALPLAAFIAGLAASNHVASVLVMGPLLLYGGLRLSASLRLWRSIIICGCIGLTPYLALPLRANDAPPLNTAAPHTVDRFWSHISAERDRTLRSSAVPLIGESSPEKAPTDIRSLPLVRDLPSVATALGAGVVFTSIFGALVSLRRARDLLVICVLSSGATLLFFSGWDPDPWVPVWSSAAILSGIGIGWLISKGSTMTAGIFAGVFITVPLIYRIPALSQEIVSLHLSKLPEQLGRQLVESAPRAAVVLLEPSWFIGKYLRDIEGVRTDLTLLHAPSLSYPEFFSAPDLTINGEPHTLSEPVADLPFSERTRGIGRFIEKSAPTTPIAYEPSTTLNSVLRSISTYTGELLPYVAWRAKSEIPQGFAHQITRFATDAQSKVQTLPLGPRNDAMNYLESLINGYADLFLLQGEPASAARLLASLCAGENDEEWLQRCSPRTLNNLAVSLMRAGKRAPAEEILTGLIERGGSLTPTFKQNLELVKQLERTSPPASEKRPK